jgi:hypothetical protein
MSKVSAELWVPAMAVALAELGAKPYLIIKAENNYKKYHK